MIYLIYPNYQKIVENLHTKHLEDQIIYIYKLITKPESIPRQDVILWTYYVDSLLWLWVLTIKEWRKRDDRSMNEKSQLDEYIQELALLSIRKTIPEFMNPNEHIYAKQLIMSHRVHCLRQDFSYYKSKFPKLAKNINKYPKGLFWMIHDGDKEKELLSDQWIK